MQEELMPPAWNVRRWLFTTNHKDIGILYLVTSLYFLVAGGVLSLLVRTQLAVPGNTFLAPGTYNQAVTVHGLIMVLWFLSPFAFAFANYFVPLQIGAKDLAYPRLNAMSYWFYLFSGILLLLSFFTGSAPDVGWTFYSPLTSSRYSPFLGLTVGGAALLLLAASVTMSSVNFIVTILRGRAPGLKLTQLPLFTFSMLVTVFMMLYAFPSLLAGLLMLVADRLLGTLYFASNEGGAILWDHVFWFFGHPEVYIVLFPGLGIAGDMLETYARRPLFAKKYIMGSIVLAGVISFVVWGHHMFVTGIDPFIRKFFTITTVLVSLPFDVIVISMIHTLVKGRIRLKTPMLFGIGSIALFVIGGITGVFLASVALDYNLRGTYWVVAHFHYVMVGGGVVALIGALYHWFPKMAGKMYHEGLGRLHFLLSFIGFNLLYFPMFVVLDMPRRVSTYPAEQGWGLMNSLATVGGFIFGLGQLLLFINLFASARRGAPAPPNPWGGWSLEWSVPSPPPIYNFEVMPRFSGGKMVQVLPNGGSHSASAAVHETHLSRWPILLGLAPFVFFLGVVLGLPVSLLGAALAAFALAGYARERFVALEEPEGERWPFHKIERMKLGMWVFLASEFIFFGVLIGSYLFVRVNSPSWIAPGEVLSIRHGAVNTAILLTSSVTAVMALAAAKAGSRGGLFMGLISTLALGLVFLLNKASEWRELFSHGFTFSSALPASTFFLTTAVHGAHVLGGMMVLLYLIWRATRGAYVAGDYHTVEYFGLYWHFVDIIWVFLFPIFYLV